MSRIDERKHKEENKHALWLVSRSVTYSYKVIYFKFLSVSLSFVSFRIITILYSVRRDPIQEFKTILNENLPYIINSPN